MSITWTARQLATVALRKESVDRNGERPPYHSHGFQVALRKESVDRNPITLCAWTKWKTSLSARRAWIEIVHDHERLRAGSVALRKESVDRNNGWFVHDKQFIGLSLSARRAWIEMGA